ncbi:MAG: hypothetical protein OHK0038_10490 [Flammeovirgaceae bacterium]
MKLIYTLILYGIITICLTACFEVKELIYFKEKGSGEYLLLVDFNKSAIQIDSAQKDILTYQKPFAQLPLEKIQKAFEQKVGILKKIEGIENVKFIQDKYSWGFSFDFQHTKALNQVLTELEFGEVNGYWQPYYTVEKKKIIKSNAFYLQMLFQDLNPIAFSEKPALQTLLNQIMAASEYSLLIQTDRYIKEFDNSNFVKLEPKKLKLKRNVNSITSDSLRWNVEMRLGKK